jgi:hypothetical protein
MSETLSSTSGKPERKTVLFGAFDAVKKVPEWHEEKFMEIYDKYFAVEPANVAELEAAYKTRLKIREIAKKAGWIASSAEVILIAGVATAGIYRLKTGKWPVFNDFKAFFRKSTTPTIKDPSVMGDVSGKTFHQDMPASSSTTGSATISSEIQPGMRYKGIRTRTERKTPPHGTRRSSSKFMRRVTKQIASETAHQAHTAEQKRPILQVRKRQQPVSVLYGTKRAPIPRHSRGAPPQTIEDQASVQHPPQSSVIEFPPRPASFSGTQKQWEALQKTSLRVTGKMAVPGVEEKVKSNNRREKPKPARFTKQGPDQRDTGQTATIPSGETVSGIDISADPRITMLQAGTGDLIKALDTPHRKYSNIYKRAIIDTLALMRGEGSMERKTVPQMFSDVLLEIVSRPDIQKQFTPREIDDVLDVLSTHFETHLPEVWARE